MRDKDIFYVTGEKMKSKLIWALLVLLVILLVVSVSSVSGNMSELPYPLPTDAPPDCLPYECIETYFPLVYK